MKQQVATKQTVSVTEEPSPTCISYTKEIRETSTKKFQNFRKPKERNILLQMDSWKKHSDRSSSLQDRQHTHQQLGLERAVEQNMHTQNQNREN